MEIAAPAPWSEEDSRRADAVWAEYQRTHDLTAFHGQAVGIEPRSGRVWFGDTAEDVVRRKEADGVMEPVLMLRVGFPYYLRKGGRR